MGGTNPSLLRALGYGAAVLALDTVFNAEVLEGGKYGILWNKDPGDLTRKCQTIENSLEYLEWFRQQGPLRIRQSYSWEDVTGQYIDLLNQILAGRSDSRQRMGWLRVC